MAEKGEDFKATLEVIKSRANCSAVTEEDAEKIAALKVAMKQRAEELYCNAIAIQCLGRYAGPHGYNALHVERSSDRRRYPVVCETDIHGAVTARMLAAAAMGKRISLPI